MPAVAAHAPCDHRRRLKSPENQLIKAQFIVQAISLASIKPPHFRFGDSLRITDPLHSCKHRYHHCCGNYTAIHWPYASA